MKENPLLSRLALLLGMAVVFVVRWFVQPSFELNPDTSAWISGAISAAQSQKPIWTLLTHSDGRPLVVLPLFLLEKMGLPVTWFVADLTGLVFWLINITLFYVIVSRWLSGWQALFYTLPLLVFQLSHLDGDLMAYNSEHLCGLMVLVAAWWFLESEQRVAPHWEYASVGFWLGLFPFAKMQIVPTGLLIAAFVGWKALKTKNYVALFWLCSGGLLPTFGANIYYAQHDGMATFWNDYFWNYYYYSFTKTYSSVQIQDRFEIRFIAQLFGIGLYTRVFWGSIATLLVLGFMAWIREFGRQKTKATSTPLFFIFGLFWVSFYTTVQAGNFYTHYLWLVVAPSLLLAVRGLTAFLPRFAPILWCIFLFFLVLEALNNWRQYPDWKVPTTPPAPEIAIQKQIAHYLQTGQKMSIWGYADRFFVWQRVAAGNRLSHTFWAYWPSPLLAYRQRQFVQDMDHNQTAWFLDFTTSQMPLNEEKFRHDNFPIIARYVRAKYQYVNTIEGVRFYERKVSF